MGLVPGTPVICQTKRSGGALAFGATGSGATVHLTALVCRAISIMPASDPVRAIFRPISFRAMQDQFNVAMENLFQVYADWVNPFSEAYPVSNGDTLVTPDGNEYVIRGVKLYPDMLITMLVGTPTPRGQ